MQVERRRAHPHAPRQRLQIDLARFIHRSRAGAQLEHQRVHAPDDVLDGHQHIALELGIVAMAFGIPKHERKLCHQVLEIVDDEG